MNEKLEVTKKEEMEEKESVLSIFREMWLKRDSPLHRIYSSWEELKKNIRVERENRPNFTSVIFEFPEEDIESHVIKEEGTGGLPSEDFKEIVYPFDKYEITVKLTPNNEFIAITEVKVKTDFMSYKEKISTKGYHDVEAFYPE